MKRIRRVAAIVSLSGLHADELEALVRESFDASLTALQPSR